MKNVKFTGTLKIVDGIGLIRETNPLLPEYVGSPTPEIDAAWDDIIHRKWYMSRTAVIMKD